MFFSKITPFKGVPGPSDGKGADKSSDVGVIFSITPTDLNIIPTNVKQVAMGIAEIAYSIGDTNDEEDYEEELSEEIMEALKIVRKRRRQKRQNN